jgi:Fe-S-cluster containining protein
MVALGALSIIDGSSGTIPCTGCHAGCCRAFAVPLTGADIVRIMRDQKRAFREFVCRWADAEGAISRNIAPQFLFDDDPETPFVIGLLQNESGTYPGTRKCHFLTERSPDAEQQSASICSIYESRPAACRVFPFRFDAAGEIAVQPGLNEADDHRLPTKLCPTEWIISDRQQFQARIDLDDCLQQMELFRLIAHRWNAVPGPWLLFPDFLIDLYSRLLAPVG